MSANFGIVSWLRRLSLGKAILLAFVAGWVLHLPAALVSYSRQGLLDGLDGAMAVARLVGHAAAISTIGFLVATGILIFSRKSDRKGIVPAMIALSLCAVLGLIFFATMGR